MDKKDFKYELGHDQFKNLVYEVQAIHSFNYQQFKKLTQISNHVLESNSSSNRDLLIDIVRDIMSFNFKQHKKLKRLVYTLNKIIDPQWSPPMRVSTQSKNNSLADQLPKKEGGEKDV